MVLRRGVKMTLFEIEQCVVLSNSTSFIEIKLDRVTEVFDFINAILEIERNLVVPFVIGGRTDVNRRLLHTMIKTGKNGPVCFNVSFFALQGICTGSLTGLA